jgi:hypothetical protein
MKFISITHKKMKNLNTPHLADETLIGGSYQTPILEDITHGQREMQDRTGGQGQDRYCRPLSVTIVDFITLVKTIPFRFIIMPEVSEKNR